MPVDRWAPGVRRRKRVRRRTSTLARVPHRGRRYGAVPESLPRSTIRQRMKSSPFGSTTIWPPTTRIPRAESTRGSWKLARARLLRFSQAASFTRRGRAVTSGALLHRVQVHLRRDAPEGANVYGRQRLRTLLDHPLITCPGKTVPRERFQGRRAVRTPTAGFFPISVSCRPALAGEFIRGK